MYYCLHLKSSLVLFIKMCGKSSSSFNLTVGSQTFLRHSLSLWRLNSLIHKIAYHPFDFVATESSFGRITFSIGFLTFSTNVFFIVTVRLQNCCHVRWVLYVHMLGNEIIYIYSFTPNQDISQGASKFEKLVEFSQ